MNEEQRARIGALRAGQAAAWVWIALAALPVVVALACCGLCGLSSAIGGAADAAGGAR